MTTVIAVPGTKTEMIIPKGVTNVYESAFAGLSKLERVEIPEGVTNIGFQAFEECSALKEVIIPESVTNIEGYAFSNCSSLKAIELPKSLKNIGYNGFNKCDSLTDVFFTGSEEEWNEINFNNSYKDFNGVRIHFNSYLWEFEKGDADANWVIDVNDAQEIINKANNGDYILGIEAYLEGNSYLNFLDMDADDKLTATDATIVANEVIKGV